MYKKEKKQMWKLERNYFTAYSLQIICKHNKNRLNEYLEDEMVDEQSCFRKGRSCTDAIFTVQQIMERREEHLTAISFIYRLRKDIW